MHGSNLLERERLFHEDWARGIDVTTIDVKRYFEGATCPENRFIMNKLGDVTGKRILDLGCGPGEASVYFALKGANVTATDLTQGMVDSAFRLAERYEVEIQGKVMNAMDIDFPDGSFDIVYAANLLHHVDFKSILSETNRILGPGGKLCFWDPLKHNPIIGVYRRMAKEVRTEDERPLDIAILKNVSEIFSRIEFDTFWLATLWIFIRFYFIEKVDPNKERYWKKIVQEESRLRELYYSLERIDMVLKKVAFLKRYAWNMAVVATK